MPSQHAKNIALTEKWYHWVDELVASGEYKSVSEVMRDGLRALELRREHHELELSEIRTRISISLEQADSEKFAKGSGEDAINRAFKQALQSNNQ
ncbi:MAG: type II toxin-antitoxin system ParD family antitoxin [Alcanivoracaceae bacterium]|nr:type II toxin-antitoxin system ParD family antitoxin [Alcanivoracaceae bacterium]